MDETCRHNDDDYHEYRIRPYQKEKSNTIPTGQLSAIISRRTNQWRDLTPESAIPRTEGEVERRLWVSTSCTPTTLATSKKPGGEQQQRQLGESQKGSDKKRNFQPSISEPVEKTSSNSNNSNNSNNPDPGNSKSAKSNKPSGGSRANLSPVLWLSKEVYESRKANWQCTHCGSGDHTTYLVPNIHGNMQRVKAQIDCGAMSIFISPSLLRKLELPYEPAFTSTLARWGCL